jgi:hypothetical protein
MLNAEVRRRKSHFNIRYSKFGIRHFPSPENAHPRNEVIRARSEFFRALTAPSQPREDERQECRSDLLVAACARHHDVAIEHCDNHFDLIASL